jgi:cytochrome c oxidase subunit II
MKRWLPYVAMLAACDGDRSMFVTANDRASQIATIGWIVLVGFTVVSVVMWALLLWAARRRRGSFEEHEPVGLEDGKGWLVVGGVIVPVVAFVALLILSLVRMHSAAPVAHDHMHHDQPQIRLVGHRWWWEVQYLGMSPNDTVISANEIHIPVGEPVTVELRSADVIHSFWIPNIHGKVDLVPGHVNHITLTVNRAGEYVGQCAEFCGAQHANMKLVVVAHEPADFKAWREHERAPAVVADSRGAIEGKQVFESKPCASCHAIRGTRALGHVGPDLTHFGSRRRLGANVFPSNRAYIMAWSTRAHSLKPDVEMPDLATMNGEELTALADYLMGLK